MVKIFLFLFIMLAPSFVFAQSVFINEIAWMGTPVVGVEEKQWWRYEWLELYNAGDTVGMLDGWTVELSREKIDFKIPLSGTISADGYFLVGASDKILPLRGISRRETIDLNYKNLGGKFFNGGQKVVLKNSLGEVIDGVDATAGWPAGDNESKQTMERVAGSVVGSDPATLWQTSKDSGGTPRAQNSSGVALKPSFNHEKLGFSSAEKQTKPRLVQDGTEKDLAGSSSLSSPQSQSFQSRVPIINPITLLAGLLALGFSGALLLVKRSLALRQKNRRV